MNLLDVIIKLISAIVFVTWMWSGVHYWTKDKRKYTGFKQIVYGPMVWMGLIYMFIFNR